MRRILDEAELSSLVAEGKSGIYRLIEKSVAALRSGGSMTAQKRGRKRIKESRAAEIRARLVHWSQIPEPQRISLRALAAEIGTSHQMLSFYLRGLDKWQASEYRRQAKAICERADGGPRKMLIDEVLEEILLKDNAAVAKEIAQALAQKARQGDAKASRLQVKFRRLIGSDSAAQKIPRPSKRLKKRKGLDAVLKELDRTTDSEKALRLLRQLTPKEKEQYRALRERRSGERELTRANVQALITQFTQKKGDS